MKNQGESHNPLWNDTMILVDSFYNGQICINLPINETHIHFIEGRSLGVWKIKKFNGGGTYKYKYPFDSIENIMSKAFNRNKPF